MVELANATMSGLPMAIEVNHGNGCERERKRELGARLVVRAASDSDDSPVSTNLGTSLTSLLRLVGRLRRICPLPQAG